MKCLAAILAVTLAVQPTWGDEGKAPSNLMPHVKIATTLGDIVVELNGQKAPVSTLNFLQYIEDKFYDGVIFHRVISTFMIQGGGYTVDGKKTDGLRSGIKNEWQNGLKNVRGSIAMARLGGQPDSGSCQFFINVVDNPFLDNKQRDGAAYAVFGRVIEGMDTVDKIKDTEVTSNPKIPGGKVPVTPVVMKSVTVVGEVDKVAIQARVAQAEKEAEQRAAREAEEKAARAKGFAKELAAAEAKATKTASGLQYVDMVVGTGDTPPAGAQVEVHYTGWLTDGTKFDSSVDRGQPFTFSLSGGVIQGWLEGVASMKVGGKRKLIIPFDLAYGEGGRPPVIPPRATLVFDVELLAIK